jgi:hypothetical protein
LKFKAVTLFKSSAGQFTDIFSLYIFHK